MQKIITFNEINTKRIGLALTELEKLKPKIAPNVYETIQMRLIENNLIKEIMMGGGGGGQFL